MSSACPVCPAGSDPAEFAAAHAPGRQAMIALPGIHCAGCIRGVEQALAQMPGVAGARVNFSMKRVTVEAEEGVTDDALIAGLQAAGFEACPLNTRALEAEADPEGRALMWRMGLAGFAMMNVMLLSVAVWSGAGDATRDLFHWISAAIALPSALIAAQPFFTSARRALMGGRMNMDVPIALAILLALGMSLYETMQSGRHAYFDAALSLTFFLLIGRYLDHRIRRNARSAAKELTAMEPARVRIEADGGIAEILNDDVAIGDLVHIQAGGRVPVDGVLMQGQSLLDLSFINGEAEPVPSAMGQEITAGTISLTGPIVVRATRAADDSTLRRLAALVDVAEGARSRYRSLSDKAAAAYAPGVHLLALVALGFWLWASGDLRLALNIAVAVLIITCPCALGLAVPAVATHVTSRLFKAGVLLKSATALERLAEVDTILFDKTGTLTHVAFDPANIPVEQTPILKALAAGSDHPMSRAIVAALPHVQPAALEDVTEQAGFGMTGRLHGRSVSLSAAADGSGSVFLASDGALRPLQFEETPVPGAAEMVQRLQDQGLAVELLSGDTETRVAGVGGRLGLETWHASVTPEQKAARIEALKAEGAHVLMVGDGLNDTGALALAHAAIAPGSALEASRNAADAVLLRGDIAAIPMVLAEARLARARMQQNFWLAGLYNLIAVPVALLGLATPLIAAIAMSASSITVIANAVRKGRII